MLTYPSTPRKVAMTLGLFSVGVALFVIGAHYSYKNVAPQQARIKARSDFVKEVLARKYGYDWSNPNEIRRRNR